MLRIINTLLFIVLQLVATYAFKLQLFETIIMWIIVLAICTVCFYDGVNTKK